MEPFEPIIPWLKGETVYHAVFAEIPATVIEDKPEFSPGSTHVTFSEPVLFPQAWGPFPKTDWLCSRSLLFRHQQDARDCRAAYLAKLACGFEIGQIVYHASNPTKPATVTDVAPHDSRLHVTIVFEEEVRMPGNSRRGAQTEWMCSKRFCFPTSEEAEAVHEEYVKDRSQYG